MGYFLHSFEGEGGAETIMCSKRLPSPFIPQKAEWGRSCHDPSCVHLALTYTQAHYADTPLCCNTQILDHVLLYVLFVWVFYVCSLVEKSPFFLLVPFSIQLIICKARPKPIIIWPFLKWHKEWLIVLASIAHFVLGKTERSLFLQVSLASFCLLHAWLCFRVRFPSWLAQSIILSILPLRSIGPRLCAYRIYVYQT